VSQKRESELAAAVRRATGIDVAECYQCGKCTAGCPMARWMDLGPTQVMRLVQVGDEAAEDRLLGSTAIWACVGCLVCTQRCPRESDPAAVMDALRQRSHEAGKVSPREKKILAFHEAFLKVVEKTGRMSEAPLVSLYKLKSLDFFSDVTLAPAMLRRGKLPLLPQIIRGRKDVRRIFRACRQGATR
jgi:heterodisulfide reductase subunit C